MFLSAVKAQITGAPCNNLKKRFSNLHLILFDDGYYSNKSVNNNNLFNNSLSNFTAFPCYVG